MDSFSTDYCEFALDVAADAAASADWAALSQELDGQQPDPVQRGEDRLERQQYVGVLPLSDQLLITRRAVIGDVDRLLATRFPLPANLAKSPSDTLHLHDILIGTRLHRGEGMLLEAFTWDGMITVCLGVDDHLIPPDVVDALLSGIKAFAEVIVSQEV